MAVVQFRPSRRVHSLLVVLKVEAHEPTCMDQGMCCTSFFTLFTVLTYILPLEHMVVATHQGTHLLDEELVASASPFTSGL